MTSHTRTTAVTIRTATSYRSSLPDGEQGKAGWIIGRVETIRTQPFQANDSTKPDAETTPPLHGEGRGRSRWKLGQERQRPRSRSSSPNRPALSPSISICSLRTSDVTVSSSCTCSLERRTRSTGTASVVTIGRSSLRTTSCSSSDSAGPSRAWPTLPSVMGSRSTRPPSRVTGTFTCCCSVATYLRSRARPASTFSVPARTRSSERGMASAVGGADVSGPTVPPSTSSYTPSRSLSVRPVSPEVVPDVVSYVVPDVVSYVVPDVVPDVVPVVVSEYPEVPRTRP